MGEDVESVKRKAIDLCHLLDRSKEEQVMLKDEMDNTWIHFSRQHELVSDFVVASSDNDDILHGEYGAQLFARKKLLHGYRIYLRGPKRKFVTSHIYGNAANLRSTYTIRLSAVHVCMIMIRDMQLPDQHTALQTMKTSMKYVMYIQFRCETKLYNYLIWF